MCPVPIHSLQEKGSLEAPLILFYSMLCCEQKDFFQEILICTRMPIREGTVYVMQNLGPGEKRPTAKVVWRSLIPDVWQEVSLVKVEAVKYA